MKKSSVIAFVIFLACGAVYGLLPTRHTNPVVERKPKFVAVDLRVVFDSYEKAQQFRANLERARAPFKAKIEQLNLEITELQEASKTADAVEPFRRAVIGKKRQIEDLDVEMLRLGRKHSDSFILLNREVLRAIIKYQDDNQIPIAVSHGVPFDPDLMSLLPGFPQRRNWMNALDSISNSGEGIVEIAPVIAELLNAQSR